MKRAAVLLSGCGNMDGSEIHESVSVIIALHRAGWKTVYTAPDVTQASTVNYLSGEPAPTRNSLEESARIARGRITALSDQLLEEVNAVVIPGGLGAVTTLCNYAEKGAGCTVLPRVLSFLTGASRRGIPVAAMCIAPVLVARCLTGASVTVGNHEKTAEAIRQMGCRHVPCQPWEAFTDEKMKIVTTPAYMSASSPDEVFRGAENLVTELDKLVTPS